MTTLRAFVQDPPPASQAAGIGSITVTVLAMAPGQAQISLNWPPSVRSASGAAVVTTQEQFIQLVIAELQQVLNSLPA
jgi:hypothetical protein